MRYKIITDTFDLESTEVNIYSIPTPDNKIENLAVFRDNEGKVEIIEYNNKALAKNTIIAIMSGISKYDININRNKDIKKNLI